MPVAGALTISEYPEHGREIATISATDPDKDILSYHVSSSFKRLLAINEVTGVITVNNTDNNTFADCREKCSCAVDFECSTTVEVPVTVSDGHFEVDSSIILNVINVDEPPFFTAQAETVSFAIDENATVATKLDGGRAAIVGAVVELAARAADSTTSRSWVVDTSTRRARALRKRARRCT